MKDYYATLTVSRNADEQEIKKAYRRLAMKYHPDRANGDKTSEERFKEINEAYAVLSNAGRKAEYDATYGRPSQPSRPGKQAADPSFSQDDILRDFFDQFQNNPFMMELMKEFRRKGMRFDQQFMNQTFFRGGGTYVRGGYTFGTPQRPPVKFSGPQRSPVRPERIASEETLWDRTGRFVKEKILLPLGLTHTKDYVAGNLAFRLAINPLMAFQGGSVIISHPQGNHRGRLSVRIPPNTRSGTKLKLRGQGRLSKTGTPGDLILEIVVK